MDIPHQRKHTTHRGMGGTTEYTTRVRLLCLLLSLLSSVFFVVIFQVVFEVSLLGEFRLAGFRLVLGVKFSC
jgi:hypothetical protein